jgi:uncharacterized protein
MRKTEKLLLNTNEGSMFIFIILILAFLFLIHYLVYIYFLRFFFIDSGYLKIFIASLFFLMPILFIFSLTVLHSSAGGLARGLYFISGIWHGVLLNFVVIAVFSFFIVGVMKILGLRIVSGQLLFIGIMGFIAALTLSVYGIYNVFNIAVKNVELEIANIPDAWRDKKIMQLSDVHLGKVFRDGHLEKILKIVDETKPEVILITGDLFDSIDGDLEHFHDALKKLDAPQGVYFVTGNHENYLGLDKIRSVLEQTNIRILDNELIDVAGAQIVGISYPTALKRSGYLVESIGKIEKFDKDKFSILMYHEPVQVGDVSKKGFDLMLAGHTHRGQMWPLHIITDLIYTGYDYGLYKEGDFHLYVSSGAGLWGPTMRTSGRSELVVFSFK